MYVCVRRTLFCPVLRGARPVPGTTGVGHFFPVFPYRPITGPCTCAGPVRGFAQFCMSRVQLRARRASATFFPDSPYRMFKGPCRHMCTCVCLVRGFAQFCMARVQFRPRRSSATFSPCPRTGHSRSRLRVRVRVFASYVALPNFAWRASGSVHTSFVPFFARSYVITFLTRVSLHMIL